METILEEYLTAVTTSQQAVVEAVKTWNEAVRAVKLPKPEEFVASGYDFAEKLLASQRKFSEDLLKVTSQS